MKPGVAGSLSSCDCRVTIRPASQNCIKIESVVDAFFHDQILASAQRAIAQSGAFGIEVIIEDKGAFDYVIEARVLTAIGRMKP